MSGKKKAPTGAFKRFAWIAFFVAILIGGAKIMQGLALALIVVAGLFITMNAFEPLYHFSISNVGYPVMVIVTGALVHWIVGAGTLGGIIATAFALSVKMFVLDAVRKWERGTWSLLGWLLCGAFRRAPAAEADVA
jgi:hypothetical protein